jgi:hypothetical protein
MSLRPRKGRLAEPAVDGGERLPAVRLSSSESHWTGCFGSIEPHVHLRSL